MTEQDTDNPQVEVESDTDDIVVVDPEDYKRTQKLKAIERCKEEYRKYLRKRHEEVDSLGEKWSNPEEAYRSHLGTLVAAYGDELIPLVEEALEKDAIDESCLILETGPGLSADIDVRDVCRYEGNVMTQDQGIVVPPRRVISAVYRQLERVEKELGLGVNLEVDQGPAEI
jgi:hypothetical protein